MSSEEAKDTNLIVFSFNPRSTTQNEYVKSYTTDVVTPPPVYFWGGVRVAHVFLVFCVVILYVFTF
jgi:hypothetical protein